jgi:SAM-dependent methyltransferase
MLQRSETYYKRDFWGSENLKYVEPHYRMEKASRIINSISRGKKCDLLDVGCGPATLARLLNNGIKYHGIDIAIHDPAPNLIQADFLESPIRFKDKKFDIIIAQGIFEYVGQYQSQKFSEIAKSLKRDGRFIVTYVNFDHRNKCVYWPYNNVQPLADFKNRLSVHFRVDRFFPTSHRWHHDEPKGRLMKALQMHWKTNIPVISRLFAVEYFFICSLPDSKAV